MNKGDIPMHTNLDMPLQEVLIVKNWHSLEFSQHIEIPIFRKLFLEIVRICGDLVPDYIPPKTAYNSRVQILKILSFSFFNFFSRRFMFQELIFVFLPPILETTCAWVIQ